MTTRRQAARDQRRVGQLADAYRQVVPLADEVDTTVVEVELDLELTVRDQEVGDRGDRRMSPNDLGAATFKVPLSSLCSRRAASSASTTSARMRRPRS